MNRYVLTILALAMLLPPIVTGRYELVPDSAAAVLMQPIWAAILSACLMGALIVSLLASPRMPEHETGGSDLSVRLFFFVLIWEAICLVARITAQHHSAYLGLMLRECAKIAVQFTLFCLARQAARHGRASLYAVIIAAIGGAAIVSAIGVNEYVTHLRLHEPGWRVFGTSTPDFLAGYLVMVLPLTLVLFLSAPNRNLYPVLAGLVVLLELTAMLSTGSRFALIALAAGLFALGGGLLVCARNGLNAARTFRIRMLIIGTLGLLVVLGTARPVAHRIAATSTHDNSTAFRLWTWRGAVRMAVSNPLFGAGPGIWQDTFPPYALTGFTRLAHNSYLQQADECGIPGLVLIIAFLASVGVAGIRGLTHAPEGVMPAAISVGKRKRGNAEAAVRASPPVDDRVLLCGLMGSFTASVVQNLIDSDWHIFILGLIFSGLAGLTVGLARPQTRLPAVLPLTPFSRTLAGVTTAALLAYFAAQGIAATFAKSAREAQDPQVAETNYNIASTWDPFNASYRSDLGFGVYARVSNFPAAETLMREAFALEPNSTNSRRLGLVLTAGGKPDAARDAYRRGLLSDPQSLDLLLAAAAASPHRNLEYYQRIINLEQSPAGQVRAIGGVTEVRFALAYSALADASTNDPAQSLRLNVRAARLLEDYAYEGGSHNPQRLPMTGGRTDPALDTQMQRLYMHVAQRMIMLLPPAESGTWKMRANVYTQKFNTLSSLP